MKERLVVVTDPFNDSDDMVALYAMVKSPRIDCIGIITTYGNARLRAKGVKKFLKMAGFGEMPVHYGYSQSEIPQSPYHMREVDYEFLTEEDLSATDAAFGVEAGGEEFIISTINSQPNQISVLSLAPMTSLARALGRVDPKQVKQISVMCGHFGPYSEADNSPYYRQRCPEYNIESDPDAAREVLGSGAKISAVGKDLWLKDLFTLEDFEFLRSGPPEQRELLRMVGLRHEHNQRVLMPLGINAEVLMYDPIALGAILFPELYEFRRMDVEIDNIGVTHATFSERGNINGAVGADLKAIKRNLLGLLAA